MRLLDYITIGFKNIWRRKSRSFLTIFAVVIGAISMIIMLSLVLGAQQVAMKQLESIDALTLVSVSANPELEANGNLLNTGNGDDSGMKLNNTHVDLLKQIPYVVDATPIFGVWIKSFKLEGQEKKFSGNIVSYEPGTKVLKFSLIAGRELNEGDMDKIVIGQELLRKFGYTKNPKEIIGKTVLLYSDSFVDWGPEPSMPPENADEEYWKSIQSQTHEIRAEVVGVTGAGFNEYDNYITLDWGRRLSTRVEWKLDDSKRKEVDESRKQLETQLQEKEAAQKKLYIKYLLEKVPDDELRREMLDDWSKQYQENVTNQVNSYKYNYSEMMILQKQDDFERRGYGSILLRVDSTDNIESVGKEVTKLGFGAQTAKDMLEEIKKIFSLVGLIVGAIGGIVLFVAALGIINNMIMATYERTREIGILRACGATRATIRNMFISEAAMLGFLGGAIGLGLSFVLAKILNIVGNQIALDQNVPIQNIISFPPLLIIGVITLTTVIGILAGLLPAIRAARLDPVEALRYE